MKTLSAICLSFAMLSAPLEAFAEKIGGGDLRFYPKGASPVTFSHEKHIVDNKMKCTSCHFHLYQMDRGASKMTMDRITKGDFCGKCHDGQRAFDAKAAANCVRCHRDSK